MKITLDPVEYLYRPLLRPAGFATLPRGLKWEYLEAPAINPQIGAKLGIPVSKQPHGIIAVDRQLTKDELERFDIEAV